ncbi:MAG: hypothetical protein HY592_05750 [Candidatus Omnitrophica bacterium]|nr:hypothetical protein [Candidatus Omnitrophota bacterium]
MQKMAHYFLIIFLLAGFAGCASVQKKFTRKKKEPARTASVLYFEKGPYQKKYSNAHYYKTHYTLWKSWQDDSVSELNGNQKRLTRNIQEAYSHLSQMANYLVPEKRRELQPWIDSLGKIMRDFERGAVSESQKSMVRSDLERMQRVVAREFYYHKVKEQVLPEAVDLGEPVA